MMRSKTAFDKLFMLPTVCQFALVPYMCVYASFKLLSKFTGGPKYQHPTEVVTCSSPLTAVGDSRQTEKVGLKCSFKQACLSR